MSLLKNIQFKNGSFTLSIPELSFDDHGVTAITGPSGSGKSTFFNILVGLIETPNWSWDFQGIDLAQLDLSEKNIGIVFQSHELFPHLTAKENVELIMKSRSNNDTEACQKLDLYKQLLDLGKCWNTLAAHLSGGEQQRVSILRAVMSKPRLLLLDEPFTSLDEVNKKQTMSLVAQVLSTLKIPALIITHNLDEAHFFTNRVIQFRDGSLV